MNTLTVLLVCVAVIVTLCGVIYVLVKDRKAQKKEIQRLNTMLDSAKENMSQLADYIEKVQKIKIAEKTTGEKIKDAKTDEEVYDIVSSIVKSNNSKLQND